MYWLDLTLPTVAENIALDEALLLDAEAGLGGEGLRVWEWPTPAVVLGAGGRIAEDVDEAACAAAGVPLARRASGGGTVLLGRGCLLYSLVLRYDRAPELTAINPSYRFILGRLIEAVSPLQPGITFEGSSDLAVTGRKFSGNAQQRKRDHLLHHGTLLYQFDLGSIPRYLREPQKRPAYRGERAHDEFVMNLPADAATLKWRLQAIWGAGPGAASVPIEMIRCLMAERYARPEWVYRR